MYKNNYDVAGICETKTDKKFSLKLPGYKVYINSRNNYGGGVLIAIKENIAHSIHKVSLSDNIEFVGIKIPSSTSNLIIGQVYKPPNKKLLTLDLDKIFCDKNVIIMGDLNCKRKEWNCMTENQSGQELLNYCLSKKIKIAAPQNPTNFPTVGNPSVIDFYLLKCNYNSSLPITKIKLSSDHNPVEIQIFFHYKQSKTPVVYDYSRANWSNFRKELNDALPLNFHIKSKEEVEEKTKVLTDLISQTMKNNIPLKKFKFNSFTVPPLLKSLITFKNRLRKKLQKKPSFFIKVLYKNLEKFVRKQLHLLESNNFERFIKNLNFKDGSIFKFANKYTKKTENSNILYDKNNKELSTEKLRLSAFAEHFAAMSNGFEDLGSKFFTNKVINAVKKIKNEKLDLNDVELATYNEVTNILKILKNNKAAGHDEIGTRVLKNLPRKAIVFLIKLINGILCTSHFPTVWKIAKVIPISKKCKDATMINSYRPISLLPHISKIVEKIIKNRMTKFLHRNKLLVDEQFGFRAAHCTTDQLARLVNEITLNFNKKLHTGALLLDIESAFPSVWHAGIIYKLILYKFPVYIVLLICSYLDNRKFFVYLGNEKSDLWKMLAGVPQGSVLGPLLFLIFINDAPKIKDVKESIYADDKLMFTASYRISAIIKRLQQAFIANKRFFHKWKIKINPIKTEAIIFTKRRPVFEGNVICDGNEIIWSDKVKYLGVWLDRKLIFGDHVNYINHKAIGSLINLYPVFKNSHISVNSKLILYKSLIRAALCYACPVWSLTCQSNINKLQITQNKFLRIIGKFRKFTPIFQIHQSLNIEYLQEYLVTLTKNYFNRVESHPSVLVRNILYDKSINFKHKRIMHLI